MPTTSTWMGFHLKSRRTKPKTCTKPSTGSNMTFVRRRVHGTPATPRFCSHSLLRPGGRTGHKRCIDLNPAGQSKGKNRDRTSRQRMASQKKLLILACSLVLERAVVQILGTRIGLFHQVQIASQNLGRPVCILLTHPKLY